MSVLRRSSLVRLYPKRWRKRYGEEFRALLDEEPLSLNLAMDVLAGALGAHLKYPMEEPIMSTRRLQLATALLALVALVPAFFVLAAVLARGLLLSQATAADGSTMAMQLGTPLEHPLVVAVGAAGVGLALVLGLVALAIQLGTDTELRSDLGLFAHIAVRLLRRPALVAGSFAVLCAVVAVGVVPLLLIFANH